jgi:hypothetical protein
MDAIVYRKIIRAIMSSSLNNTCDAVTSGIDRAEDKGPSAPRDDPDTAIVCANRVLLANAVTARVIVNLYKCAGRRDTVKPDGCCVYGGDVKAVKFVNRGSPYAMAAMDPVTMYVAPIRFRGETNSPMRSGDGTEEDGAYPRGDLVFSQRRLAHAYTRRSH